LLLEIDNVTKSFDNVRVVNGITFGIEQGEIIGLLGPNGAGKSTTIQMVMGLIRPTSGDIRVFGLSLERHHGEVVGRMNVASPYLALPSRLTVLENLTVYAGLYGVANASAKIAELLQTFDIVHLKHKLVGRLSSGECTRVGLAKAFLNDPKLLLLDEPTAYLDPQAALQMRQTLLRVQKECGTTVLYTSHNMEEVEQICSRIIFLHRGRIIAAGSPIEVSRAILKAELTKSALQEVYLHVAAGGHR